jgi:hypothetical protein
MRDDYQEFNEDHPYASLINDPNPNNQNPNRNRRALRPGLVNNRPVGNYYNLQYFYHQNPGAPSDAGHKDRDGIDPVTAQPEIYDDVRLAFEYAANTPAGETHIYPKRLQKPFNISNPHRPDTYRNTVHNAAPFDHNHPLLAGQ